RALVRWVTAWLRSLGVEPEGDLLAAEPSPEGEIGLLHLLLLGHGGRAPGADGAIRRTVHAGSVEEAQRLLLRFARQLCDARGEPWRTRYVRDLETFERDGFRLRREIGRASGREREQREVGAAGVTAREADVA